MGKLQYVVGFVALAAVVLVYKSHMGVIHFRNFSPGDLAQQLTPLLLVAVFIERSLEVFLTVWRGGRATTLQRDVEKATALADNDPSKVEKLHAAKDALANYKFSTQQIAFPLALVLGMLICALGIRGLGTLVDWSLPSNAVVLDYQRKWFNVMDVLLTGALVGGGSDFVHQVITTITDLMDATSQKAKG